MAAGFLFAVVALAFVALYTLGAGRPEDLRDEFQRRHPDARCVDAAFATSRANWDWHGGGNRNVTIAGSRDCIASLRPIAAALARTPEFSDDQVTERLVLLSPTIAAWHARYPR